MNKGQNMSKGITLIALVITIIVMLILVGVTISMALNGGLFGYAKKAGKGTSQAIEEEKKLANGGVSIDGVYYNSIEDYYSGKKDVVADDSDAGKTLAEVAQVGENVAYEPGSNEFNWSNYSYSPTNFATKEDGTQNNYKAEEYKNGWKILNKDSDGYVYLMSNENIGNLYMYGYEAAIHLDSAEPSIIQRICSIYCNNDYAVEAYTFNSNAINNGLPQGCTYFTGSFWCNYINPEYDGRGHYLNAVICTLPEKTVEYKQLAYVYGGSPTTGGSATAGIRPIIKLKANIKTLGKNAAGEWILAAE